MHDLVLSPLKAWETFYVIVGSAGGALTGLQFVVLTLIGESRIASSSEETLSAFGTPNVVHFCAALLISCVLSAPWTSLGRAGFAVAIWGALGVLYTVKVLRRTTRQRTYRPVLEDWVWHITLPMLAYATIFVSGVILGRNPVDTLFFLGGATLLLVFIGIHNAWDTVTFVTVEQTKRRSGPPPTPRRDTAP
jgi:hypothetical protein